MRLLFSVIGLMLCSYGAEGQFGSFASAVYMSVDGGLTRQFYNTQPLTGNPNAIGSVNFSGNLGSSPTGDGKLLLYGGEVKTFKRNIDNVCGVRLFYRIYPSGNPGGAFALINLPFFANCVNGVFSDGFGPCSPNDQKWQKADANVDLSAFAPGNYTLEVYFEITGQTGNPSGCGEVIFDNNNGNNYSANFTVSSPLPVNLKSFEARQQGKKNRLEWTTLSEENFSRFDVQYGNNGASFTTLGTVNAKAAQGRGANYQFEHATAEEIAYYRLKMIDKDGSFSFSPVVLLRSQRFGQVTLYPNPVRSGLQLHGLPPGATIRIVDATGRELHNTKAVSQNQWIPATHWPRGNYWVVIIAGNQSKMLPFMVE